MNQGFVKTMLQNTTIKQGKALKKNADIITYLCCKQSSTGKRNTRQGMEAKEKKYSDLGLDAQAYGISCIYFRDL